MGMCGWWKLVETAPTTRIPDDPDNGDAGQCDRRDGLTRDSDVSMGGREGIMKGNMNILPSSLSVYLSICLSVYLSICLSVYLSICLSPP